VPGSSPHPCHPHDLPGAGCWWWASPSACPVYKPNLPIALIEAKDNHHSVGEGMQQALEYAEMLDVPFVYNWHSLR
jgi:hypothetical protein